MKDDVEHDEVLTAPLPIWLFSLLLGGSIAWALGFFYSEVTSAITLAVGLVVIVALVGWLGAVRICTTAAGLRAGQQQVPWDFVGEPQVLDACATRERLGANADVRASLIQRWYIRESVEVPIVDPADPHPYWLISSRRPQELAAAINRHRVHA